MRAMPSIVLGFIVASTALSLLPTSVRAADAEPASALRFRPAPEGGFHFDTGVLRGGLRPGGKSLGLVGVTHVRTGKRLDSSNGLLSHYRVFTQGKRYGGGAWDWPGEAVLRGDGAVEVRWTSSPERPFDFGAVYRWCAPDLVELETTVAAKADLKGFEAFVANYFSESFTNAAVWVASGTPARGPGHRQPLLKEQGDWQLFPRDQAAVEIASDGRWHLPPNPVDWTVQPRFALPIGVRADPISQLTAVLLGQSATCFAVAAPHQAEGHRSIYFSLFGRDVAKGEAVTGKVRIWVGMNLTDESIEEAGRRLQSAEK